METANDMERQRLELLRSCMDDKIQRIELHIKELKNLIGKYRELISGNE